MSCHKQQQLQQQIRSTTFQRHKALQLQKEPKYPPKSAPRRNKLTYSAISKLPLNTECQRKTEDHTLVLTVNVKANKHQRKFCDTDGAKVNILDNQVRPDGEKKTHFPLALD
uniref:60S ribosomal protein L23a-like n=1 Tax=Ictidomys tridecemlineatus TaxID=43179 RepID=UPI00038C4F4A|nr:60S ribosomal protein L23a-like [Ictidomys tridecemlineatus]